MASSKQGSLATEFGKYPVHESDVETQADEVARLMREVAEMKTSAEEVPLKVLFEGSDHTRGKWLRSVEAELKGLGDKGVLEQVSRDNLHNDLGLGEAEVPPCPLPMKLVLSQKAGDSGQEEKEPEEDIPWRSKARLCACGNFEAPDGEDVTTQNVSPAGLRLMAHQLSKHKGWIGASGDVSLAFPNSALEAQEVVLLEPAAVLRLWSLVNPTSYGEPGNTHMDSDEVVPRHGEIHGIKPFTTKSWIQLPARFGFSLFLIRKGCSSVSARPHPKSWG